MVQEGGSLSACNLEHMLRFIHAPRQCVKGTPFEQFLRLLVGWMWWVLPLQFVV